MNKSEQLKGLSNKEAIRALKKYGPNELEKKSQWTAMKVFSRQFANVIVWILIVASVISFVIGEELNFWVINFIIVFVIVMGFIQEYKAERVMEALKKIIKPLTTVIRDGNLMQIEVREVVPGDVLSLEMGDQVPADAKIIDVNNLEIDESQLTGESVSVHKHEKEMIYAGTQVVYGRCLAQVIHTGMKTKLGSIASLVQTKEEITPLQKRMDRLGKVLAIIALSATGIILFVGVIKGVSVTQMLIVALALAVAAVPEGLPLTMTLSLSFGMSKMARQKAVVRRMMAVETLGSTTVICTDKTGTLTQNEMTVQKLFIDHKIITLSGLGYSPTGDFREGKKIIGTSKWREFFQAALLCNNGNLRETENGSFLPVGDPTEVALITMGEKAGFLKEKLDDANKRVEEIFFTASRKMMTTIHKMKGGYKIYSKGAPEIILEKCSHQLVNGQRKKLTAKDREQILKQNHKFAKNALRIIALASKEEERKSIPDKDTEKELTFLGLVAMRDPARAEVPEAIRVANSAGMRIVMITGDNKETALSIARQIGLVGKKADALTGEDMDALTDKELSEKLQTIQVFARTQPEHKLRIVSLLKKAGEIVAMTGDGVNDAPALKKADIGIAMGIKGTDVSKQAADMILQDDNFATIITAVEEGRRIYQNIEKFTGYLISRNFTEVILIFLGILFFDFEFLPLLAIQILFINAFDEEMPAIGLGLDKAHGNLMNQPPRPAGESLLNRGNSMLVFGVAIFMALTTFIIYITHNPLLDVEKARTMVFATIVTMVIVGTYNFRSMRESIFVTGVFNNPLLFIGVSLIAIITLFVMYFEPTQRIFSLTSMALSDWMICIGAAMLNVAYVEGLKFFRRNL
ncbi:MAG: cation-transporting P-type ATPase [Patescibacteria group bacterium]